MTSELAFRCIGISHLLQPPLSLLLARRLNLPAAVSTLPPLTRELVKNMALASICLPTSLGISLAVFADQVSTAPSVRAVAWLLAAFWSWRLYRQLCLGRQFLIAFQGRRWHFVLALIFFAQGPLLAVLLAWNG